MTGSLAAAPWLTAEPSRRLMDVLTAGDIPARFVGGCVRDALLGDMRPDVDLDVATPLRPEDVVARLESAGFKAVPTGIAHGTVTAIVDGRPFEITTLRKDIACDGRHAEVEFTDDFRADAARRDFTINAMSTDRRGRLVDYFGGEEDLKAGRIRFVGDARTRVREDYLRILRFFRFFARYGRPPVDADALAACQEEAAGLARISGERIRSEMLKLLASRDPVPALEFMIETKVLAQILAIEVDLVPLARLIRAVPDSDPLLRLAALLRSTGDATSALAAVGRWKLSNAENARLERLTRTPLLDLPLTLHDNLRKIYRLGSDSYLDLLKLSASSSAEFEAALPLPAIPPFPITGQDLLDRQVPPGPELGKLLEQLEDWWLENDLQPDRDACLHELNRRLGSGPPPPGNP
ncbi:MAG: CCA tRNA nucleotidyltransferase [Alphaproteobacteria bacterium]